MASRKVVSRAKVDECSNCRKLVYESAETGLVDVRWQKSRSGGFVVTPQKHVCSKRPRLGLSPERRYLSESDLEAVREEKARGLTNRDIAKILKIHESSVSRLLAGGYQLSERGIQ